MSSFNYHSPVDIREYQFSDQPGYYNFYNNGMNEMRTGATKTMLSQTLTLIFDFSEDEQYINGKMSRVEIKLKESVRIYAVCGSPDWITKNTGDIAAWAMQIEKETSEDMKNRIADGDPETVTVVEVVIVGVTGVKGKQQRRNYEKKINLFIIGIYDINGTRWVRE